jgi:ABC-type transport system substrate-binding protein
MNWTAFRRAVAFAMDKEAGVQDIWEGYAEPFDASIPPSLSEWSIEEDLTENYYTQDKASVQTVLSDAGFTLGMDGWWYDPNGVKIDVEVKGYALSEIAMGYAELIADSLVECNISATAIAADFNTFLGDLYFHGDFDLIFGGRGLNTPDPVWMYYEYHSQFWNTSFQNSPSFQNATMDVILDELLVTPNRTRAIELAKQAQEIIWYECPMIGLYMNKIISAFRTDQFVNVYTDSGKGTFQYWGKTQIRLNESQGGPFGGTLRVNLPTDIDTLNYMTTSSGYTFDIMEMTYEGLITRDPYTENLIGQLAYDWNSTVTAQNTTEMYFHLHENVTWHDGTKFNASDVVFTFEYLDMMAPAHTWVANMGNFLEAEAIDEWTVRIVSNTTSVFDLAGIGGTAMFPKHIWENVNASEFATYEPDWAIGTGPYNLTTWVPGEFVQQDFYFDYYNRPVGHDAESPAAPPIDPTILLVAGVAVAAVVVVAGYFLLRKKPA